MLTVTVPAADANLIAIADLRVAAGYAADDATHDAELLKLSARLTADIVAACNVAIATGAVPTLRREALTQTFRYPSGPRLVLARRHDVEISSVVLDDEALTPDDFEVASESGLLSRISGGCRIGWRGRMVTVNYLAGFADVPADLAGAAYGLARIILSGNERDPLVKSRETDTQDVLRQKTEYWVGPLAGQSAASGVPDFVAGQLARFRSIAVR